MKENKRVGEGKRKGVTQRWDICFVPQVLGGRKESPIRRGALCGSSLSPF